jgi:hypothetical protein
MTLIEQIKKIKISRLSPYEQFMINNNLECVFMGTGLTYYKQYLGDDILYLTNGGNYSLMYNETNGNFFSEYHNKKYILNKYGLKAGDKIYYK